MALNPLFSTPIGGALPPGTQPPTAPSPERAAADYLLAELLARLQGQSRGITVRQHPHVAAPFRAQPLCFGHTTQVAGAGGAPGSSLEARFGVQWTAHADSTPSGFPPGNAFLDGVTFGAPSTTPLDQGEPLPDGVHAVITRLQVWAWQQTALGAFSPVRSCRWSAFVDGQALSGFQAQLVSSFQEMQTTVGAPPITAALFDPQMQQHFTLQPGQRMELSYLIANDVPANVTVQWVSVVEGYSYPTSLITDPRA